METQEIIQWQEAIRQMRELSKRGKTFSFSHATYSRDKQTGGGVVVIQNGQLRKSLPGEVFKGVDPDMLLPYLDDNQNPKMCYKHLLLSFNGLKVVFAG